MTNTNKFHLHKEEYLINNQPCRVIGDFENETITIHARGFSKTFPMDEYTNFEGDMKDFATSKLK